MNTSNPNITKSHAFCGVCNILAEDAEKTARGLGKRDWLSVEYADKKGERHYARYTAEEAR